ncbi:ArsR family transcriptional regulator [Elstera cyanobacteriorum]|uniref:Transcriptional regulator n=1 Tax=Elstera cyanobacteriorum TaxID=2022747 RepID=A0A255XPD0_9PROT|nr:winged helix-turn-helix domain-containing protein [Elstera cyanobacteriorum]OYQ18856.1 transcriptional regulator [Elstera cyanobacteriorum]GFZ77329.1 ArsR family transcriptional regulator [Elstera cyanobacteriorum]
MKEGPSIAPLAALIGDPARANMLTALMDGRALTVSELAGAAGVALPTASEHLGKLDAAGLLAAEKQGRHRYFRLSGPDVAEVLEGLMGLAQRTGATRTRTGPKDPALREARVCYDHLAGEKGVALFDGLLRQGFLAGAAAPDLTAAGHRFFEGLGFDLAVLRKGRRPLCRHCLDWSERRGHLGGALGAASLAFIVRQGWATREPGRVVRFSRDGGAAFAAAFRLAAANNQENPV